MQLQGKRVLAVDDDAGSLARLNDVLGAAGAEVLGLGVTDYALPTMAFRMPDVVIVDAALPHHAVLGLVRRLRALPADHGGKVPVLVLATRSLKDWAEPEWREAGVEHQLLKPFDPEELVRLVAELAAYQRGPDASSASAASEGRGREK